MLASIIKCSMKLLIPKLQQGNRRSLGMDK